jgi:hypothetical protein
VWCVVGEGESEFCELFCFWVLVVCSVIMLQSLGVYCSRMFEMQSEWVVV